ncbi:MAG: DUF2490 domain-containing protein [Bacteroidia bacterium]
MRKQLVLMVFLVASYKNLSAQSSENQLNFSYMLVGQLRVSDAWSIHADVQEVNYEALGHFSQFITRIGMNYHLSDGSMFTAGAGYIRSVPFENDSNDLSSNELRLWQDARLRNNFGRLRISHRYRFEERWIKRQEDIRFAFRVRYLILFSIPLNHQEVQPGTWSLTGFDEVFVNVPALVLSLNRISGGLSYQLNQSASLQVAYQYSTGNGDINQRIQTGLFWRPDFRKPDKTR